MIIDFFLQNKLINQKLAQNLLTWKHSGFSVDNKVKIPAFSQKARETLSQYLVKPHEYENLHYVIRLVPSGWKQEHLDPPESEKTLPEEYPECSASSKQSRSAWARLIDRLYQVNPLECPKCHSQMRILSVITDPEEVKKILRHLVKTHHTPPGLDSASLN